MPRRTAIQKSLVGPAGEHFVLFRLYQQGMLASLSPPGSPTVDVLVLAADESVIATLQVKTRTRGSGWVMGEKHERIAQPRCFYAFINLDVAEGAMPVTYIVPSAEVAGVVAGSHKAWLAIAGKGGRAHRDNPVRQLRPRHSYDVAGYPDGWMDQYLERWDFLKAVVGQADHGHPARVVQSEASPKPAGPNLSSGLPASKRVYLRVPDNYFELSEAEQLEVAGQMADGMQRELGIKAAPKTRRAGRHKA
jgi:hypothetical protein